MTNPLAAIGLAQLNRINEFYKSRKKIFDYYNKKLSYYKFIKFLPKNKWSKKITPPPPCNLGLFAYSQGHEGNCP